MRLYYFDDSGDRSGDPAKPFFTLGGFGIDAEELPQLRRRIRAAAFGHNFQFIHPAELKFQHVGRTKDKHNDPNWMIRHRLREAYERRALVYSCLRAFCKMSSVKVLVVAVDQRKTYGDKSPIIHAIQPLFERINHDCAEHQTHGLVICDEEQADDRNLRGATRTGSFYMQFAKLMDTISFMPSEESIGVQMADLIAGSFSRYLNYGDPGYARILWPKLRSNAIGRVNGFGIKLFPGGPYPSSPPPQPNPLPDFDAKVEERVKWADENERLDAAGQA